LSVTSMKYISIAGAIDHIEHAAHICGITQSFQPDDVLNFYSNTKNFFPITVINKYKEPLERLKIVLENSDFKMKVADSDDFKPSFDDLQDFSNQVTVELGSLINEKKKIQQQLDICSKKIADTKHFLGLDIELDKADQCEYIKFNFGRLPIESYRKLDMYENDPYLNFFACTCDGNYYWGVYISPVKESYAIDRIFSGLFFQPYEIEGLEGKPESYLEHCQEQKLRLEQKKEDIDYRITYYKNKHYNDLIKYYSKLVQLDIYCNIINKAYRYNDDYFILVGWIPANKEKLLLQKLSKIESVEISISEGNQELSHSPPVKLKNFFMFRPFEYYTEMYGLPCYNEADPTAFIAITYMLLFGIMFADLGQGVLLLIISLFMWKRKKMALGKVLVPCSLVSIFFGTVFGSAFGFEQALDPIYKLLFNLDEKPIDVTRSDTITTIIYAAVGIGMVLVITAMLFNIYSSVKRRNFAGMLLGVNGIAGLIFYTALIVSFISQIIFKKSLINLPYILSFIVLPFILIYLREPLGKLISGKENWKPAKWGAFLTENFFEMFEVLLSYVTNTMSFLRVGAFVLVHTGMMKVVFVLADMFGPFGWYVTVIAGNILVIFLEALLVGIQVLRLEYYEMFSRFYMGEGRSFEPIKMIDER